MGPQSLCTGRSNRRSNRNQILLRRTPWASPRFSLPTFHPRPMALSLFSPHPCSFTCVSFLVPPNSPGPSFSVTARSQPGATNPAAFPDTSIQNLFLLNPAAHPSSSDHKGKSKRPGTKGTGGTPFPKVGAPPSPTPFPHVPTNWPLFRQLACYLNRQPRHTRFASPHAGVTSPCLLQLASAQYVTPITSARRIHRLMPINGTNVQFLPHPYFDAPSMRAHIPLYSSVRPKSPFGYIASVHLPRILFKLVSSHARVFSNGCCPLFERILTRTPIHPFLVSLTHLVPSSRSQPSTSTTPFIFAAMHAQVGFSHMEKRACRVSSKAS